MGNQFKEEAKSGFVGGIVKAFDGFVQTFKKYGLLAVTFILVLFILFYSFILHPLNVNDIVMKALEHNHKEMAEAKERSIKNRLEADKIIMQVMQNIVEKDNISRVMLFELHNNTQNISGVDFLYMSCTYEMLTPEDGEIEYIADSFQKQYLSNFMGQQVITQLMNREYIVYDHLDNYHRTNYRFIAKLKQYGAKSMMVIPFYSDAGEPLLVMMVISNKEGVIINAPEIYDYVKQYKGAIHTTLITQEQ